MDENLSLRKSVRLQVLGIGPYLHDIFIIPSVAFWQSLHLQLSLVWCCQLIRWTEPALTFDLTLTKHLSLLRKFYYCIRIPLLRAFDRCLALLALPVGLAVRQGDIPPPLPANVTNFVGWRPQLCAG